MWDMASCRDDLTPEELERWLAQRPDVRASIDDAHRHPELLVRGRRRPEGL